MKRIIGMKKSFTLVELIIGVTIFAVLITVGMATFSTSMGAKSKTAGINIVRDEADKIMAQIEEMVTKGNTTWTSTYNIYGVGLYSGGWLPCEVSGPTSANLYSRYTDSNGDHYLVARVSGERFQVYKGAYKDFSSSKVVVSDLKFWGYYRRSGCTPAANRATLINVSFKVTSKEEADYKGEQPSIIMRGSFTPGYPNPDLAGDSVKL